VAFHEDAGLVVDLLPESHRCFFRIDFLYVPGPPAPAAFNFEPIAPSAAGEILPSPELPLVEPSLLLIQCQQGDPLMRALRLTPDGSPTAIRILPETSSPGEVKSAGAAKAHRRRRGHRSHRSPTDPRCPLPGSPPHPA